MKCYSIYFIKNFREQENLESGSLLFVRNSFSMKPASSLQTLISSCDRRHGPLFFLLNLFQNLEYVRIP
jgi:hypothetical protein